ncbi:MAG: GatB/YqeY domain-containing protein [Patescibacteria group bacterium]|jgi:hypothetical protein
MTLLEQIEKDLIQAIKDGNEETRDVLRFLKSSIQKREKDLQKSLTEEELVNIIAKDIKMRKESIDQFISGSRHDLADAEQKGIAIIEKYLPAQLPLEEVKQVIADAVKEVKAKTMADMGKVMAKVMTKLQGKADGSVISQIVKDHLK